MVKTTSRPASSTPTLNQLIQLRREARGFSLPELARKLGITTEALRDIEDHEDEIADAPLWLARKLSALLAIPPEQFFINY